jgi:hypothetical protein
MTLLDRITQVFKRQIVATAVPDTAQEMPAPSSQPTDLGQRLKSERERKRIVETCNEMYDTDPRAEGAINALARDIVKGGFSVTCRSNPRAGDVATAFNERMKIQSVLDDWLRETFIEGDTLLEVGAGEGLSGEDEILSLTRKPTLAMHRHTDHTDQFSDPLRAFYYSDGLSLYADVPPDAIWFAQWQIVHARWAHRSKRKYGRPLFASAISSWKRITEGELDIAVRRKTRAGMKYLHVVEGADESDLTKYKERNKAVLDNPFAAVADLFSNKAGSVTAIQGDARLGEISDVMHHIETWWTASPVPMVLVGYGKDSNRDVLEQKLTQYERALEQMTQWAEDEFVKPLLEREWLLKGIYPPGLKYDIVWKYKAPTSAADLRNVADAIVRFKALGMSDELIWPIVSRFLPWLDLTNLLASGATTGQVDQQPARLGTGIT